MRYPKIYPEKILKSGDAASPPEIPMTNGPVQQPIQQYSPAIFHTAKMNNSEDSEQNIGAPMPQIKYPPQEMETFWHFKDDVLKKRDFSREPLALPSHETEKKVFSSSNPLKSLFGLLTNDRHDRSEPPLSYSTSKLLEGGNDTKIPIDNLEEELQLFMPKAFLARLLDKFVAFAREEDATLFKEIKRFQKKNPGLTRSDVFESFGSVPIVDVIIKIVYNESLDFFMTYRNFEYFGKSLEKYRYQFFSKMMEKGLVLIFDVSEKNSDRNRDVCFVAPFDKLADEAEKTKLKLPLTLNTITSYIKQFDTHIKSIDYSYETFNNTYRYTRKVQAKRSSAFERDKIADFEGGSEPVEIIYQKFFTTMHRGALIQSIISHLFITREFVFTQDDQKEKQNASDLLKVWFISDLISKKLILRYHPLHSDDINQLRLHYKSIFKPIGPLTIRNYFGEEVAFYFGWVQFYTEWCIVITLPGILSISWAFAFQTPKFIMNMSISDLLSLFDNSSTIFFAFWLNLSSLLFLKFWKRRKNMLSFLWDVDDLQGSTQVEEEVRNGWRPSKKLGYSEVTGEMIPAETNESKILRRIFSACGLLLIILGLLLVITAFVLLQAYTAENEGRIGLAVFDNMGTYFGSAMSSALAAFVIVLLGVVADKVVVSLIHWENHRTLHGHLSHYIWMQFFVQFFNIYGNLLFTAVLRPVIYQTSPDFRYIFGPLTCKNQGSGDECMKILVLSVSITFIVVQFSQQLLWWSFLFYTSNKLSLYERSLKYKFSYLIDKQMVEISSEKFEKVYNSRLIQFGFLVLFSSAFPFGPIFALLNNFFQGKLNGDQYLHIYTRPLVVRSNGIGPWETIAQMLVLFGIIVNGVSLPFLSDGFYFLAKRFYDFGILEKEMYSYHQVVFIIIYQYLMLLSYFLIEATISDVPTCVRTGRRAEKFISQLRSNKKKEDNKSDNEILDGKLE